MKRIGILGTGIVGATLGKKLLELGYEVKMGSRTAGNEKALEWVKAHGKEASEGTFADAAQFGEIIFVCTRGEVTLNALNLAGLGNLRGKIVIDVTNPLDFSKGMPPGLLISNGNSLGEEVQNLLSESLVVKTLNIVNCGVMVEPKKVGGDITMLLCGDDMHAKEEVLKILRDFGWTDVIDLGDIKACRVMEMLVPPWVAIMTSLKTPNF